MNYEHLFSPIKIGNIELRNRINFAPMAENLNSSEGYVTDDYIAYMTARTKGGYGLVTTGQAIVKPIGKAHPNQLCIWDDSYIPGFKKLADSIHSAGGKLCVELNHAGRSAKADLAGGQIEAPTSFRACVYKDVPKEMTREDIEDSIEAFVKAAVRLQAAGVDMVMLECISEYLMANFLSPLSNKRSDKYGGMINDRALYSVEVTKRIREACGPDFGIIAKVAVDAGRPEGHGLMDGLYALRLLEEAGADCFDVIPGVFTPPQGGNNVPTVYSHHGLNYDLGMMCKKVTTKPVSIAGKISPAGLADTMIAIGACDIVSSGRAGLADPEWPNKALEGREEDTIHCIACVQGCVTSNMYRKPIACILNPITGRELKYSFDKVAEPKKIMIIGGGIAGMEAAITAAQRGHKVSVYEKADILGGQWIPASGAPCKTEHISFVKWQKRQLDKLCVDVHLNTEVTLELIDFVKPDKIIVATGACPATPPIPGVNLPHVVNPFDVLSFKVPMGLNVVVIGGGPIGVDVAAHAGMLNSGAGGSVTVLEMLPDISPKTFLTNYESFLELDKWKVNRITSAQVKEISEHSVVYYKDGVMHAINGVDTVVIATGTKSDNKLANMLKENSIEFETAGDVNQPRLATEAIFEGFEAGMNV